MKLFILCLFFSVSLTYADTKIHCLASNDWFQEMHGTDTIKFTVDYTNGEVLFSHGPWFSNINSFEINFQSSRTVIARSNNTQGRQTLLEIDWQNMILTAGDGYNNFGKNLTSSIICNNF